MHRRVSGEMQNNLRYLTLACAWIFGIFCVYYSARITFQSVNCVGSIISRASHFRYWLAPITFFLIIHFSTFFSHLFLAALAAAFQQMWCSSLLHMIHRHVQILESALKVLKNIIQPNENGWWIRVEFPSKFKEE